jgi:ABC-type polysaccharide/polyol phosphate transport system ATPase subunit
VSSLEAGQIRLRGVSRRYRLLLERNQTLKETILRGKRSRHRDVWALNDVDLDVLPGQALGVVGANGAGKSTLLKLLAGILPANSGTVEVGGKVVSLLELGSGFHPDFTGRENVYLNASIHGMTRAQVDRKIDGIIEFAELEGFIDAPVRTYSSGMYMRLGFAVAAELDPEVLLLDEVFAVGDAAFQSKCLSRIADFQRRDVTIVFVSHSQWAVQTVCNRAIWISGGSIVADGDPTAVLEEYHHGLVDSKRAESAGVATIAGQDWQFARITSVSVAGPEGVSDRLVSGEPCTIEVVYETVEPVTPVTTLTVKTVDGMLIAGIDDRSDFDSVPGAPGMRTATFHLESLPLMEGRFAIDVVLERETGGYPFHQVERAVEFTVFSSGRGFGPVALPGRWQVTAGSPRVQG